MDHSPAFDHDALELRLGEAEVPLAAPDVAAFTRAVAPPFAEGAVDPDDAALDEDALRLLLLRAGLVDGPLRRPTARARLVPLLDEGADFPIPAPTPDDEPVFEDMSVETCAPWSIPPVVAANIAILAEDDGPMRPRAAPRWRPLVVAAVSLPLLVGTGEVWAAPAVQRPATTGSSASAPESAPPTAPTPPELPGEPVPAAEVEDAPVDPAPEATINGASAADAAVPPGPPLGVPEAHYAAMKGLEVQLTFARGGRRKGRLITTDGASILYVDYQSDGRLISVPKSEVLELRGLVPTASPYGLPDPSLPRGTGMLVGGGIATGVSTPFFLTGVAFLFISPSFGGFFLIPGMIGLAVGIPLLVKGARRRRAYLESAYKTARLTPGIAPTRGGWTGGLTLRF